jgi:hypothetical protein
MRCLFICSPTSGLLIKFIWRQRACDENLDPAAATVAAYPKISLILCSWAHDWRKSLPYLLTSPTKTFPVIPILLALSTISSSPPSTAAPLPRSSSSLYVIPIHAQLVYGCPRRRLERKQPTAVVADLQELWAADRAAPPCDVPHGGSDRAVLLAAIRFRAGVGSHADNTHTRRPAHNNFHHVLGFVQCRLSPPGIAAVLPRSPQMIPCGRLHAIRLDRSMA